MLEARNYKDYPKIVKDVEPLFLSAFPEQERPPKEIFFSSFKKKNHFLLGFYKENTFIGFVSTITYKDICYIFFFAVEEAFRNKGFGSEIIKIIKNIYKDYTLLLCYEEVDEKYADYEKRKRRENFYFNNGFVKNPAKTNEFGVIFQTAVCGSRFVSFEEYREIFISGFSKYAGKHLKQMD